jgi:hypothetical protein
MSKRLFFLFLPLFLNSLFAQTISANSEAVMRSLDIYRDSGGYIFIDSVARIYGMGNYQRLWGNNATMDKLDKNILAKKLPQEVFAYFTTHYGDKVEFVERDSIASALKNMNKDSSIFVYELDTYEQEDNLLTIGWSSVEYVYDSKEEKEKQISIYDDDAGGSMQTYSYAEGWGWHIQALKRPLTPKEKREILQEMIHYHKLLKLSKVVKSLKAYRKKIK